MKAKPCFESRYDIVIVGARCAGASTALVLARAGAKVLVIDRQKLGTDTVSTHALMRAGVMQLKRLGVLPQLMARGTPPVHETSFHYGTEQVRIDIKPEHSVEFLCAPRRTVLDTLLVEAAREAGAEIHHGVSLTKLRFDSNDRVTGVYLKDAMGNETAIESDIVIGADGRQSCVARGVGAQSYAEGTGASGYVYGYFHDLPDEGFQWYFAKGAAAGIIPTNDDQHCIFVGVPHDRFAATFRGNLNGGFMRVATAISPHLVERLIDGRPAGRLRGFSGGVGFLRQSHGPGWALVGDAGYFKDPLTAHGITDALTGAEILSRAILDGRRFAFAHYQVERDRLALPLFDATDAIAAFDWNLEMVKRHHMRLSDAMKAECDHIGGLCADSELAA